MKFQIIVSLAQIGINTSENVPVRPFRWVSASGTDIDEMVEKLQRHAVQYMNVDEYEEAESMAVFILTAFKHGIKYAVAPFSRFEQLIIKIRDEADIAKHEAFVNELMSK